jgi:hypothetical protein
MIMSKHFSKIENYSNKILFKKTFLFHKKTPQVSSGLHLKTCATQEKVRPFRTSFNWAISNLSRLKTKSNLTSVTYLLILQFTESKEMSNFNSTFPKKGLNLNRSFATIIMSPKEIQKKKLHNFQVSYKIIIFVIKCHDNDYIHTFSTMSSIKSSCTLKISYSRTTPE